MTDEDEDGDEDGDDAADGVANATASDSDETADPVDNDGDEQVEDDSEKSLRGPRILVRDAVYPGAVIGIGHSVRIIDTRIDHCILREVDDQIRIFPL